MMDSTMRRRLELSDYLLLVIVLLAAVPRLYLGATQFVEYDGYWHIFAAQQDRWHNFVWDVENLAHPPLYYLLLRWSLWLGKSFLAYRAIPIVAGLATVWLMGRIASKVMRSAVSPLLVALAYALALPAIVLSGEVRAYGLCLFFVALAYLLFLDIAGHPEPGAATRTRILFAVTATLACLTEYYAVFFMCALFGIGLLLPFLHKQRPLWKAWAREAATFAPPFLAVAKLYQAQVSKHVVIQAHLLPFYYDPAGEESASEFLLRNLQATFNLFSPWPVADQRVFIVAAAALLIALCGTLWAARRIRDTKNLAAAVTVVATVLILVQLMVASVVRVYPFGGLMRQQSVLFPFLVLSAFLLPDRLFAATPRRVAYALAAVLTVAVVAVSYLQYKAYPKVRRTLLTAQMQRFDRAFPSPQAVYLDQFNLIAFYLHHTDWKWQFDGHADSLPEVDVYRVTRGNRQMIVFRDKGRWILDCQEPALYDNLARAMRARGVQQVDLFRLAQDESPWEATELRNYRERAVDTAAAHGLCLEDLVIHERDVYAQLAATPCKAAPQR